jgi:chromosome segregation ATPase
MEQKTKFILIGLILVSVFFLALFMGTLSTNQKLTQDLEKAKKQVDAMQGELDDKNNRLQEAERRVSSLSQQLERVGRERDELQRKYESVNQTRDELLKKLKEKQAQPAAAQPATSLVTPTRDANEAYWAAVLKAKTDLEFQLDKVREELKSLQINNEQLQRDRSSMELDLNTLKTEKEDLERQLEYNKKLMDSISQELVRERNDKMQIQMDLKQAKNENTLILRQLKGLNNRKVTLERKVQELQDKKDSVERRLTDIETMLLEKSSQVGSLKEQLDAIRRGEVPQEAAAKKESVELPAIVVYPQQEPPVVDVTSKLNGKVLAINKDNNFVIVDLGEEAGAKMGDKFQVYRDGQAVAMVEVIQLRKNISACDIKKEMSPIAIGDTVR